MSRRPEGGVPTAANAPRYHIETWGCQMNVHDSEKLASALEREGYRPAASADEADVVLLNTCAIREKAEEKVFSELGRLRRWKAGAPGRVLGVCGCVAQQSGATIFRRAPHVDLVIGPRATASLPRAVEDARSGPAPPFLDLDVRADSVSFPFDEIRREGLGAGKAFVTIIEGCNHRCTYCVVPRTRGPEICRPMVDVLAEVRALAAAGVLEIEFLGQTVNAYRDTEGNTLGDLLRRAAEVPGVERIRFTTSHPAQMTDRLLDAMRDARPRVCPYLHLPAQSGSTAVLRAMRRGYDREGYLARIDGLRSRIPEMRFGTDIIVGFPTESEADFQDTETLVDEVQFDVVYSFAYSERPGTRAVTLGDSIDRPAKHERLARLQARQLAIQERRNREWVGRTVEVLVEGQSRLRDDQWTGRTPENRIVHFAGPATAGRLLRLRVTHATALSLRGEALDAHA
jgi:tRNA-2-methylthio-N6-dimethylallyladenosine synthase